MAYRGSFYYDDYDYENYPESLVDYEQQRAAYDEIGDQQTPQLSDVLACGVSVSHQIATQLLNLLCVNLIYRFIRQSTFLPDFIKHLSSSLLGYLSTFIFFSNGNFYICLLMFASFTFLKLLQFVSAKKQGFLMIALQIALIFTCEIYEWGTTNWQHVRGSALIISMKAISVAFDVSSTKLPRLPPIYVYAGYVLCPANLVLGPFVTFTAYNTSTSCHHQNHIRFSLKLFAQITLNSILSIIFINFSSCFLHYLISSDYLRILGTYRDALVFRCSHYFISYMSSATLLVSGIESRQTSDLLGFEVTKPLDVELPRSLIPVVISWNIPIHLWVKTYIFRNVKRYGKFNAILLTYVVSSSLHGLNIQLAAVLLSIGIFTFVEFHLRNSLAEILDACVAASRCNSKIVDSPENNSDTTSSTTNNASAAEDSVNRTLIKVTCSKGHRNTTALFWVKMINFGFGLSTTVLLAYLGVLLDISSEYERQQHGKGFSWEHSLKKWIELKFFGHIIVAVQFLIYLILRN